MVAKKDILIAGEGVDASMCGVTTWWELSGLCEAEPLRDALNDRDVPAELHPVDTTPAAALARALRDVFGDNLIRPLKGQRGAWAVVEETQVGDALDTADLQYSLQFRVMLNEEDSLDFSFHGSSLTDQQKSWLSIRLETEYEDQLAMLSTTEISAWLSKMATQQSYAVALRTRGGFYYVPQSSTAFWELITEALSEATDHTIFTIPALRRTDAVDAVMSAVMSEVDRSLVTISEDMKGGDLGKRAVRTRVSSCEGLLEKLSVYSDLLGGKLGDVQERIRSTRLALLEIEVTRDVDTE
jgi:hypothetical protein